MDLLYKLYADQVSYSSTLRTPYPSPFHPPKKHNEAIKISISFDPGMADHVIHLLDNDVRQHASPSQGGSLAVENVPDPWLTISMA